MTSATPFAPLQRAAPVAGRVLVLVPALDAARTVAGVVVGLRDALPDASVLVIDDGSRDGTGAVAARAGARVLRLETNRGKGAALRAGVACALAEGADAVLTVDADGQHDPARAPALLAALANADVVIGTRRRDGTRMPLHRRLSNALSSYAISTCAGTPLADSQSGYRAIAADVLRHVQARGDHYEYETDFLILAARAGYCIAGVPIPTIYGARSHFRLPDALRVVATIWRHRMEPSR